MRVTVMCCEAQGTLDFRAIPDTISGDDQVNIHSASTAAPMHQPLRLASLIAGLHLGLRRLVLLWLFLCAATAASAADYTLKEGDLLRVSVWGEDELDREVRVLPDGSISFPLVGSVRVAGQSVASVESLLANRVAEYVPEPDVSVAVLDSRGNRIFVLGKVANPGSFALYAPLTVVQALALAGGLVTFADENDIQIVRMEDDGQRVMRVKYNRILSGRDLSTNHRLMAGDTILVP